MTSPRISLRPSTARSDGGCRWGKLLAGSPIVAALLVLAPGCAGPSAGAVRVEPDDFTLVLLRTGPEQGATSSELSSGHLAFMKSLAADGKLLIAGPYGQDKSAEDLRGIFVLDEADAELALELARADPTTRAGVFRQEAFPLQTLNVIRALTGMETAHQKQRMALGEDLDAPDVRPYCVVVADDGARASQAFRHAALGPRVVLFGRLGPPREGALFAILDVDSADKARALIQIANESGAAFEVSEWWSSPVLAELAVRGPVAQ